MPLSFLLRFMLLLGYFASIARVSFSSCIETRSEFNETVTNVVSYNSKKCFVYTYRFVPYQNFAGSLCVNSTQATKVNPLLVVARESIRVKSFSVPKAYRKQGYFHHVCRTFCPLQSTISYNETSQIQSIHIEISTLSPTPIGFEMVMFKLEEFNIRENRSVSVELTPSLPRVFHYKINSLADFVRIEARSNDTSCMFLAVQEIKCPFFDNDGNLQHVALYQTMTTKGTLILRKKFFPYKDVYIVLVMKVSNRDCLKLGEKDNAVSQDFKEVTLEVEHGLMGNQFFRGIWSIILFYILFCFLAAIIFLFMSFKIVSKQHEGNGAPPEKIELHLENPTRKFHVSQTSVKGDSYAMNKANTYFWTLLVVGIFYAIPVVQLVYINQRIVYLTGNQDICYYNFLCANPAGILSDFNHVFSNIGYFFLGFLFTALVWIRHRKYLNFKKKYCQSEENKVTGLAPHFGVLYAMGWSLVMEGVLSSAYHVCPNEANFQFDTAFMFVILIVCMLKLYISRHSDIAAKSFATCVILALLIVASFGWLVIPKKTFWVLFLCVHLPLVFYVCCKIAFIGKVKWGCSMLTPLCQSVGLCFNCSTGDSQHKDRFRFAYLVFLVNGIADLVAVVDNISSFGLFLVILLIVNLGIYLSYYLFQKYRHDEKIGCCRWVTIILAAILWGVALMYFIDVKAEWKKSPAESRTKNDYCLELLNFYDTHDLWHFLSSIAIFLSYMILFIIDDDTVNEKRTNIAIF